jgi:16S rRNA (adenine1518-N6/adenine1519-N6)-dimethyltransferase
MNLDLSSPKIIKEILTKYETKPSKGMGQNFLVNKKILEKIIISSDLKSDDTVLEVGPGLGTLTQELAKIVGNVIAIEKDRYMCQILEETLQDYKNIKIINDDILKNNFELPKQYKLIANIPYYLTSPLIRKFLEIKNPPEFLMLMIQKEVAQRICASPPNMSVLAVSVQFYAEAKIISYVKKENFWPKPKVDSAIIKITPKISENQSDPELFFKIVKAGFSQPRKQLGNNLSKGLKLNKEEINLWLSKNKIKPTQRAETLSIADWKNLLSTACCF